MCSQKAESDEILIKSARRDVEPLNGTVSTMAKIDELTVGGVTWVDVEAPTKKDIQLLGERFGFSQLELEDCMSKKQLQKIEHHGDHLFVIVHFPWISVENHLVSSTQISIFLGDTYLVTVHQRALGMADEIFTSVKDDADNKANPGFLLYRLLDRLVDDIFPLMEGILKELDDVEEQVFDEKLEVVRELTTLRRNVASLRRTISPLRRIMAGLYDEIQIRTPELAANFRDMNDHIEKAYAVLDEARETVEIFKDADFTVSTERSNKILAILTIMFTLSIPGTMIGTFYGMNILLPGGIETGSWTFLGPYTTFALLMTASLLPALVMLWYFHRLGWV